MMHRGFQTYRVGVYLSPRQDAARAPCLGDRYTKEASTEEKPITNCRGGSGDDAGRGPLWPPVVRYSSCWSMADQSGPRRAAIKAPTPPHAAPAPTGQSSPAYLRLMPIWRPLRAPLHFMDIIFVGACLMLR